MGDGSQNSANSVTIAGVNDGVRRIVITRNHSLTHHQAMLIVIFFFMLLGMIGIMFVSQGAWMVLPFAGLEFMAVATGFYVCVRHNYDYELVEIDDRNINVKRITAKCEQQFSFQTYWTKIMLQINEGWQPSQLYMQSKGNSVELGRWLTESERNALAIRLKKLI